MKIEHIAIYVKNLEQEKEFLKNTSMPDLELFMKIKP